MSITSILLCTACSTKSVISSFTPAIAKPDQAIVYIYRPSTMSNALYSPGINIDSEFKLYTRNGSNTQLSLAPGEHTFEFQAEKRYTGLSPVTLMLDAGSRTFLRVNTSLKIENSVEYKPYVRTFTFTRIEEQAAVKEITQCCLAKPEQLQNGKGTRQLDENTNDGFSVDKTQNPFSN